MMMQEGRAHKHFALQLDVRAYKYQTQKLEHLFQGRVPDKSSEVVFQATAKSLVEEERINDGRWT